MRFADRRADGAGTVVGGFKRSSRNAWLCDIEPILRDLAPLPISYDVDSTQPTRFSEYSYTEFLGGLYINTQSVEINTRLIREASSVQSAVSHLESIAEMGDKYELNSKVVGEYPKKVAFMVGHNMFDLVSPEVVARAAFENDDFYVKLHPLTNEEYAARVAAFVGWDRIIPGDLSGVELLSNCEDAYVSTATELCALAVALGKNIHNISSFFNESSGIYYPINSVLFKSEDAKQSLNNILDCHYSGIIFPWTKDPEQKIRNYFDKTLELRETYKQLASPSRLIKQ